MSNNKNFKLPETALFTDDKGNTTSLIEVLGGKELAIESGHHTYKTPNTAMMVDDEGNLYNLIDVIKNAVDKQGNSNNQGTTGQGGQAGGSGVEDSDKVDYIGEQHRTLKETNDANVEYLLREINTAHHEGTNTTATDTYAKQVKSAKFKGQTLVNILGENEFPKTLTYRSADFIVGQEVTTSTTYTIVANLENVPDSDNLIDLVLNGGGGTWGSNAVSTKNGINSYLITTNTVESNPNRVIRVRGLGTTVKWVMIFKGDYTKQEIPYFEGMQSVKSPVLTSANSNIFPFKEYVEGTGATEDEEYIYVNSNFKQFTIPLKTDGGIYTLYADGEITKSDNFGSWVFVYEDGTETGHYLKPSNRGVNTLNKKLAGIRLQNPFGATFKLKKSSLCFNPKGIGSEPHKTATLTTLSDLILRGIGDVYDTLDLMTGEHTVWTTEKVLNGEEKWINAGGWSEGKTIAFALDYSHRSGVQFICDKFNVVTKDLHITDSEGFMSLSGIRIVIRIDKAKASTLEEFKRWLSQNNTTIIHKIGDNPVKKTVDLKGQKIYSYDGTTHYTCTSEENHPAPILSIDVPTNLSALVSRQRDTIQSLTVENQEIKEVNEAQDIEIEMNQDAINFILFAQTVKSVNEEKGDANTMAVYLANQILKGRLDYALVVSRYPEFKEDIDTILIAEGRQDLIK